MRNTIILFLSVLILSCTPPIDVIVNVEAAEIPPTNEPIYEPENEPAREPEPDPFPYPVNEPGIFTELLFETGGRFYIIRVHRIHTMTLSDFLLTQQEIVMYPAMSILPEVEVYRTAWLGGFYMTLLDCGRIQAADRWFVKTANGLEGV